MPIVSDRKPLTSSVLDDAAWYSKSYDWICPFGHALVSGGVPRYNVKVFATDPKFRLYRYPALSLAECSFQGVVPVVPLPWLMGSTMLLQLEDARNVIVLSYPVIIKAPSEFTAIVGPLGHAGKALYLIAFIAYHALLNYIVWLIVNRFVKYGWAQDAKRGERLRERRWRRFAVARRGARLSRTRRGGFSESTSEDLPELGRVEDD